MVFEIFQIKDIEKHIDENTLLVFDLDNTLITSHSYYGSVMWEDELAEKLQKEGISKETAIDKASDIWQEVQPKIKMKLIEKYSSELIAKWKTTCSVIGLTARGHDIKELTSDSLKLNNITFSSFDAFLLELYHEGILFCSYLKTKSELLSIFINEALREKKPKKIIMVDDKKYNLDDILESELLKDFDIKCFHYLNEPTY